MLEPVSAKGPILPAHVIPGREVVNNCISGNVIERLELADILGEELELPNIDQKGKSIFH